MFRASLATVAVALSSFSHAQDVRDGFERTLLPYPGGTSFTASVTLSTGEFILFDGLSVVQYSADGNFPSVLGTFPSFLFPSFLALDANEDALYVGESSNGDIFRLFTGVNSAPDFVLNLPLNYDAAVFEDELWVSAATCGFGCGNELWRVDLPTITATLAAQLPGASGPLVLGTDGSLFYATASDVFPPPPGASSVVRFARSTLKGPLPLTLADALPVASGFDGAARLARDVRSAALFLVENDFFNGTNRIRLLGSGPSSSPVLYEGAPGRTLGGVTFLTDVSGSAAFLPYQPAGGGTLVHTSTDFASVNERAAIAPRRPLASVSGPGTLGAGTFTVSLQHGVPAGFARLHYGPRTGYQALEPVYLVRGLPLSFGLALGSQQALPGLFALDGAGSFSADFLNPGGYEGFFALQFVVLTPALTLAGTSSAAFL